VFFSHRIDFYSIGMRSRERKHLIRAFRTNFTPLEEIFRRLTWLVHPDEKHTDALVINRLVSFNDGKIIEEARAKFRANLDGSQTIPADFRGAIYRAVANCGNDREYEGLFELYIKSEFRRRTVPSWLSVQQKTRVGFRGRSSSP